MSVGIVSFSTLATTLVNLTEVTYASVRQTLVEKLPTEADGVTAIGKALLEALKLLENAGDPRGGVLILVSDGVENQEPLMADVKHTLLEKGVILHVILISDYADKNMIELSAAIGGQAFFDPGTPDTTDLQSALRTIVSDDDVSSPGAAPVQVGTWTIIMKNQGQSTVVTNVAVTSKSPSEEIYPIRARTFLSQHQIDFNADSSTMRLVVRAQVTKGYTLLIGVKVEVQLGTLPWKLMKDDGLGMSNDAVF
ncbi:hypothetical protein NP493_1768g00021 [Ridgeia piscesae]|uniref:VWFA domain-containing protein n=1 Tax=Ridgeia piscesae TaxID=27915 RepID=A0AAD9JTH0_RIDPI|nr:hypothetical protein NP493_1768g00021 [Ridgeia piscesae]